MGKRLEVALGILNGLIGDRLAERENGLATTLTFAVIADGRQLPLTRAAWLEAYTQARPRVAILVHGLMGTEQIWKTPDGSDIGSRLAADCGLTPLYLRYNSGRTIAENGVDLARLLTELLAAYPVPIAELIPIGYSMGGLVLGHALSVAAAEGQPWLPLVRRVVTLGTPHLGAPLERLGRAATDILGSTDNTAARLVAQVVELRSAGIKDLGDGARPAEDPTKTEQNPPPSGAIRYTFIAGALASNPHLVGFIGDAMVSVSSATNGACTDPESRANPPPHVRLVPGVGHLALPSHPAVYAHIQETCQEP